MAWLCHAGCEDSFLDGVSPALRARASDFGKTQSHQRSSPPLIRPTDVGYLRLTLLSNGTHRWAFGLRHPWLQPKSASNIRVLAPNRVELCSPFLILPMPQRRSLSILPRGLDKRARLSESEGDQNRAGPQLLPKPQICTLSPWERAGVRGVFSLC